MRNPGARRNPNHPPRSQHALRCEQVRRDTLTAELAAARARAQTLIWEKVALLDREFALAQQFDRRLIDSLQLIASLLSMQSRSAATLETALQLNVAASRIVTFAQSHHRLDVIDIDTPAATRCNATSSFNHGAGQPQEGSS